MKHVIYIDESVNKRERSNVCWYETIYL